MSKFTELAQQAYDSYHNRPPAAEQWTLRDALDATLPFLQTHAGDLDAMPGLRTAFQHAEPHEWQAMWTEYCHLGDLLYTLQQKVQVS
jgi:hypothetical protein